MYVSNTADIAIELLTDLHIFSKLPK